MYESVKEKLKVAPVAEIIRARIFRIERGRLFTLKRFNSFLASAPWSVKRAIGALVKSGDLERVYRGVYMRPKNSPYVGRVRPSALKVARFLAKENGHKLQPHGAEAVRQLGLSTQMQIKPIYLTSGPSRVVRVRNSVVQLIHQSPIRMQHAGTRVGVALTALFYLGREAAEKPDVILAINKYLSHEELRALNASRIPSWMRKILSVENSL